MTPGERAEQALALGLRALGIEHEQQYAWGKQLNPPRLFRADLAVPAARLLVEVEGGAHIAGLARFQRDQERRNLAVMAGWRVLTFTPAQALNGTAALEVQRFLKLSESDKGGT